MAAYEPVAEEFSSAFFDGVDVWMLLNHILDSMLSSAVRVLQNKMPDTDETAEQVFGFIYSSVEPMLVWSGEKVIAG